MLSAFKYKLVEWEIYPCWPLTKYLLVINVDRYCQDIERSLQIQIQIIRSTIILQNLWRRWRWRWIRTLIVKTMMSPSGWMLQLFVFPASLLNDVLLKSWLLEASWLIVWSFNWEVIVQTLGLSSLRVWMRREFQTLWRRLSIAAERQRWAPSGWRRQMSP